MKKNIFKTLSFSLALSFCFAAHAETARDMKLLTPLKFAGKSLSGPVTPGDLQGLDRLPVDTGGQTPDGLPMTDMAGQGQPANAKSCVEYKDLRARGYAVQTTADRVMESFYINTCGTLEILAHATPAPKSLFANDRLTVIDLTKLPALMLQNVSMEDPGPDSPCANAANLKACATERGGKIEEDGTGYKYTDGDYTAYFTPALKADIDGDGWEDLVVNYQYSPNDGSFRAYDQVCVSRKERESVAKVIPCNPAAPEAKP
jgi:hypothetical protein